MPDKNARTKRSDREGTASTLTAVAKTDVREAFGAVHVEQWLTPFLDVVSYSSPQCPQMVRLWKTGHDLRLGFVFYTHYISLYHCIITGCPTDAAEARGSSSPAEQIGKLRVIRLQSLNVTSRSENQQCPMSCYHAPAICCRGMDHGFPMV